MALLLRKVVDPSALDYSVSRRGRWKTSAGR